VASFGFHFHTDEAARESLTLKTEIKGGRVCVFIYPGTSAEWDARELDTVHAIATVDLSGDDAAYFGHALLAAARRAE
jgi:hypothetical protein